MKSLRVERLLGAGLIGFLTNMLFSTTSVSADEPDAVLTCKQNEQVIFSSSSSDINSFDASQYGAVLVQVVPFLEANINLYIFSPGVIFCSIPSDLDTSSVNL